MRRRILLLSGQVCAGKTTLAKLLQNRFGAAHVKTSDCIRAQVPDVELDRRSMQEAGEALDRKTGGAWVLDAFRKHLGADGGRSAETVIVLDAVRIRGQIDAIRAGYGNQVLHIHLEAPQRLLETRYSERGRTDIAELSSYAEVMVNATERAVVQLAQIADVVISTERCTREDVLLRAVSHAGLFGRTFERTVDVLVGGQYGSEGKGQVAAYLASEYRLLVRVGGPNAGHTVWQEPGPFTFHHLPSGTNSNPDAALAIAAGAVIRVPKLLKEIAECQVECDRLAIDPQAMVITDNDIALEQELAARMGSTGQGVGAATARRIEERWRPRAECTLAENCRDLRPFLRPVAEILDEHYGSNAPIMLEGTQGTALSLFHGPYPYVTSRDTTVAGCLADAGISPSRVRKVVMVCRTYPIRVQSPPDGTSGPMSLELEWGDVAERSGIAIQELERAERTSTTNRGRRVGEFDWALLRRSASLNAPTDIALTFVDYIDVRNRDASRIEQLTAETLEFIEEVERVATTPVSLISVRFHSRAIIDRRRW